MKKVQWHLDGGLTRDQVLAIHHAALRTIEKVGIHVPSEEARRMLQGKKGVVIRDSTRACVSAEKVVELFGPWPKQPPPPPADPGFSVSGYSLRCYDLRTGEIRESTTKDMVEFTKIAHQMGARGCSMIMPRDMPQRLAEVATYKLCMDVSDRIYGAGTFSDAEVYDFVQEMLHAMGKPCSVFMHMLSPMAFDPFLLEMGIRYIPKKAYLGCSTMPMQGASCPLQLPGALVQSCAEVMGGAAILKLIAPENEAGFDFFVYPFDMRHSTIVFGGPDFIMANLAVAQMAEFYGKRAMGKAFNNMSKFPGDAQMGYAGGAGGALMALAGIRNFGWAGQCCVDEIASAEQLVVQWEMFKASMHIANGFDFNAEDLCEDVIMECIKDNSFLTHEKTVRDFRKTLFQSDILSNESFGSWDKAGRLDIRQKARARALKLLEEHQFKRDPAEQRELDALWKKAQERFG
ncbi:MAG: trimethylamine methyltransferase family protein [Verrucomicrobiae bacterium]|nr:trimethylamine methyltransferase family protein [Verrucomicrobiae bacterium]